MTIREIVNNAFGVDLPIAGGWGRTMEDAIVVETVHDYVGLEYATVRYLYTILEARYETVNQRMVEADGRIYDVLRIRYTMTFPAGVETNEIDYWFDITMGFNAPRYSPRF